MKILKASLALIVAGSFLALTACSTEPAPAATTVVAPAKAVHATYQTKFGKVSAKHDTKK